MFQKPQADRESRERDDPSLIRQSWSRPRVGRFELIARLGRGATGVVYEARDTRDGSLVALKLLTHADARAIAGFKREFRTLCELAHENLVQLHELFAEGELWYFTMELVRGVPFTRYVRMQESDSGEHDLSKLEHASRQLLQVVSYLHASGRAHCDLKPSNILVTKGGRVVVLDLSHHGTPEFMAPEVAAGGPPTPESDAFALGVILFQTLHGALPAGPADPPHGAPPSNGSSQLLRELGDICTGLMQRDPERRLRVSAAAARLGAFDFGALAQHTAARPEAPFVGRRHELSLLHAAFNAARRRGPVAVFISGASGIGKSALCDAFAATLSGRAVVLRGACHEREAMPHNAFDGVIDALARYLCELSPAEQRALEPPHVGALQRMFPSLLAVRGWKRETDAQLQPRQHAVGALKLLLGRCAQRVPLVLIADDLQWGDVDSAQLLLELLEPPHAPPLLYVGCHRPQQAEASEFLEVLFEEAAARWRCECHAIELGSLSDLEADALTALLLGPRLGAREPTIAKIVREAAGQPLLISELARHFGREVEDGVVPSLAGLFAHRTVDLGPSAQRALMLLALAATPVQTAVVASALASRRQAAHALQQLLRRGLIRRGNSAEWAIYHDAFREHARRLYANAFVAPFDTRVVRE